MVLASIGSFFLLVSANGLHVQGMPKVERNFGFGAAIEQPIVVVSRFTANGQVRNKRFHRSLEYFEIVCDIAVKQYLSVAIHNTNVNGAGVQVNATKVLCTYSYGFH